MQELVSSQRQSDSDRGASPGASAAVSEYLKCGYSALSHGVVDYWMPKLSGAEFKLLVFLLRCTVGDRSKRYQGDLSVQMPLKDLSTQTGIDREAVIAATRDLESRGLLLVERAHRQTTIYNLLLPALLAPWVGISDPEEQEQSSVGFSDSSVCSSVGNPDTKEPSRVGNPDTNHQFRVGNPDAKTFLESGKPTQNTNFESGIPTQHRSRVGNTDSKPALESGKPTPLIGINKNKQQQQLAAAVLSSPEQTHLPIADSERIEIRRISDQLAVQIDGQDSLKLKAGVEAAGLTLAHLRWFLRDERFSGARDRKAVLLSIARDFRIRSDGIEWPESLEPEKKSQPRGFTAAELLSL